jgi:predicted nuclease with TOPRIM domain
MVGMNNEEEKIEPTENIDPDATTESVEFIDVSMEKQDLDDILEKDGLESLTDEAVEQPMDTAEPEDSELTDETWETAFEAQSEEDPFAEEPAEVAEEEGPEEATDETDKRCEGGIPFPEDMFAPEEEFEFGSIVNAAETFSDDTIPDKEHTEIEANEPVKPESTTSQTPSSSLQPTHSSKLPTAALLLGILAVVCAVAAGLYSQILKVELESLRQQLVTTELAPVAAPAESTTGELDRLNTRIDELDARLEEYSQSVKLTEQDWDTVKERFEKIEQSINAMRMSQKTDVIARHQTTTAMAPNLVKTESPPAAKKGDWVVNIESHINENDADRLVESYRSKGLPVEKFSVKISGKTWYRLRVTGFSSAEEAEGYIKSAAVQNDFPHAWKERTQ